MSNPPPNSVDPNDLTRIRSMKTVTEIIDALPESQTSQQKLLRREGLLLTPPPVAAMKFWRDYALLPVAHFAQQYVPTKFAPPRDVFACDTLRLEWQQMKGRQPFYHRNGDVDEMSYQVDGDRTLMTELGSVELRKGDFSRIPVGIAHDNYGREEVHLLFYVNAPVVDAGEVVGEGERKEVPFEGWSPRCVTEMMTECLGAQGCDIAVSLVDEELLLAGQDGNGQKGEGEDKLCVQRAVKPGSEVEWVYKSKDVWIGNVRLENELGETYQRHRSATAIHCQIDGTRTLVTQRGTVELQPGDFISVPRGCAYTSICDGKSSHIVLLSTEEPELKAPVAKMAETTTMEVVAAARKRVQRTS